METQISKIPENVVMVRKPGKRYFYVSVNREGAEKWYCNGIISYVVSTDGGELKVPGEKKDIPCGCDQPEGCSWEGCNGFTMQIIEAQEYDERFFSMLQSLFKNIHHKEILGNGLYEEVLLYIENARKRKKKRKK